MNAIVIKIITGITKSLIRNTVRSIAAFPLSRKVLNRVYLKLNSSQRAIFHSQFAKIFRNKHIQVSDGNWKVVFMKKTILMPLSSEQFWLDWDSAVSIIGYDIEVKQTYEALIGSSSEKPELFIDIGANYGTHSLLFLVHGIQTITFEPNSSCHGYFIKVCQLNHVTPKLEDVALGERQRIVELAYPKRNTWLGSIDTQVINKLNISKEMTVEKVQLKTVDDYFSEIEHKRTLIKIDTEGNELSVLQGAIRTLQEIGPMIIFESWQDNERSKIFDFFKILNYSIYNLPWDPKDKPAPLIYDTFMASSSTNFIAVPISN